MTDPALPSVETVSNALLYLRTGGQTFARAESGARH